MVCHGVLRVKIGRSLVLLQKKALKWISAPIAVLLQDCTELCHANAAHTISTCIENATIPQGAPFGAVLLQDCTELCHANAAHTISTCIENATIPQGAPFGAPLTVEAMTISGQGLLN